MEYINQLPPGPLGGEAADQALAARWVQKLSTWDGNLFLAANSDQGEINCDTMMLQREHQLTSTDPHMRCCSA